MANDIYLKSKTGVKKYPKTYTRNIVDLQGGSGISINKSTGEISVVGKQDTLTAGDGITIVDNEVSAKVGTGLFFDSSDQICLNNATQQTLSQVANKQGVPPTIVITLDQVISTSPLTIQLTSQQYGYIEDNNVDTIWLDGTQLGFDIIINIQKTWFNINDDYIFLEALYYNYYNGFLENYILFTYIVNSKTLTMEYKDILPNVVNCPTSSTDPSPMRFARLTQEEYDALATKDPDTFYIIVG